MALQSSGQISLSDIATEFGGSTPHALSEYYGAAAGVPSSGTISLASDFYGKANVFVFSITSNQTDADLGTLATSAGWDGSSPVEATVNSGVTLSGNSYAGLRVPSNMSAGVTLINNGVIIGRGGDGALGRTNLEGLAGSAGNAGVQRYTSMTIQNNGTIGGGGGGGGAGGSYQWSHFFSGCGGGGGGGRSSLTNSSGGGYQGSKGTQGNAGNGGSYNAAGNGGNGSSVQDGPSGMVSGNGGNGGGWGSSGNGGNSSYTQKGNPNGGANRAGGAGGSGGAATTGNGSVTWTANGTRYGTVA